MALLAGLLYSQARALLAMPRAQVLVQRIIGALAVNGGQRFAAQVGETAGRASLFDSVHEYDEVPPATHLVLLYTACPVLCHTIDMGVLYTPQPAL